MATASNRFRGRQTEVTGINERRPTSVVGNAEGEMDTLSSANRQVNSRDSPDASDKVGQPWGNQVAFRETMSRRERVEGVLTTKRLFLPPLAPRFPGLSWLIRDEGCLSLPSFLSQLRII